MFFKANTEQISPSSKMCHLQTITINGNILLKSSLFKLTLFELQSQVYGDKSLALRLPILK